MTDHLEETGLYQPDESGTHAYQIAADLPQQIDRYRVVSILGEGSFGRVFLAHDDELNRPVAIKVPRRDRISSPEDAEGYLAEARTVASLDHPHIVPVLDVGRSPDGLCYVVSKFVPGDDLAKKIRQTRPSQTQAAELIATVAEALHHAHKRGLVHRDVKPGNILIDTDNNPHVADFGLALKEEDFGKGAKFAGTPAYMSPEQARGEGHRVDGRSDIFSLGVVFYELLAGRRPFKADSQQELLEQITSVEARPPRQIADQIPQELERICLKALSKRATERFSTAKDMADDLRHFLTLQPVPSSATSFPSTQPVMQPPSTLDGVGTTATPSTPTSDSQPIRIIPKGLRSFDAHDADFFLELLPGPRDRDGLPDSIRFWKTRIEEMDADNTFSVGLIYGPSGCGKSSLVKAGLIPRLSHEVIVVYVEATADETETRLLNGLRKRCPDLPGNFGLKESLLALRRGQGIPAGKKVVIMLDQFEQWLHAKKEEQDTELVQALRQCDGGRVQCVVMVRDDFWMAATRFMRELEVRLVEAQNSAAADLFDLDHARRVLAAFGRAFGKLPNASGEVSREQKEFLKHAVSGLAQEGKVISVRLALFAEMMKGRLWTPATLKEVGGTEGVGMTFLEETFSASTAPPEHRYHQKAARAVLKSLLPESGTDIKGHMRTYGELLEASGYRSRPQDFNDLVRILDSEIRLITPTDPEGKDGAEESTVPVQPGEKYYQLTHDYLVPSLRDWLTRKQKETRRGRAELLLVDRAAVWNARPENRQLPSLVQWLQICSLTQKKNWTQPQRKMMRRAGRYQTVRGVICTSLLVMGTCIGLGIRSHLTEQDRIRNAAAIAQKNATHSEALVGRVFDAHITQVPNVIQEMESYRAWTDPLLKQQQQESAKDARKQLHASLALLPADAGQVDFLYQRLLTGDPQEVAVIRQALLGYKTNLSERLWPLLENPQHDQNQRFRAACALAAFASADPRWTKNAGDVAATLVIQRPLEIAQWTENLKYVAKWLIPPLATFLVDETRSVSERGMIATVYGSYAADIPDAYTRLEAQLGAVIPADAAVEAKTALAKKRASFGVSLLVMGHGEKVWPFLRHSSDPTMRSFLIDRLGPGGVDAKVLINRLETEPDVTARRAILLSFGEYGPDRLSADQRLKLVSRLLQLYREDPDAGIHGVAEWLLRQWDVTEQVQAIDKELATGEVAVGRKWYLNRQGQTLVVVPPPGEFWFGMSPNYKQVRIERSFAVSNKEVTAEQFRRFMKYELNIYTPTVDCPQMGTRWYDAVAYCNWLSDQEGLPSEQWCYEPNEAGKYAEGMKVVPDYLQRTGYRLPTTAEWEFVCRAGADTLRAYGDPEELLPKYAWYSPNSVSRTHPVGTLRPNDWGLFDLYGNAHEWCQDLFETVSQPNSTVFDEGIAAGTDVHDDDHRVVRGGTWYDQGLVLVSAILTYSRTAHRPNFSGFRVARTVPPVPHTPLPPTPIGGRN